ncbi:Pentatricopeptide repeat-containing protein [Dorcoceras hygrometricum]|uniref:Pentatricopeptide repeat-containing protein n=1 Tax=Dorcoceras hygrometricum TaxID=472368 RepID=A0A2Z7D2V1_9LAMI|nr:Pentatricopeptide repeat-containing protein [Dorcoceras hygrometricum]
MTSRGYRWALFWSCDWMTSSWYIGLCILCDVVWISWSDAVLRTIRYFILAIVGEISRWFLRLLVEPDLLGILVVIVAQYKLLSVLGFDPMSLQGLVCFFVALFSGNPGSTAGRGFNPAGGAPGGG